MFSLCTGISAPVLAFSIKESLANAIRYLANGSSGAAELGATTVMKTAVNIMTYQETDAAIVTAALNIIAPIGFLLMVVNFMMGYAKSSMRDHEDGVNAIVRAGIWLVIADFALWHLGDIASTIMGLSGVMGDRMLDSLKGTATSAVADLNLDTMSIIGLIVALIFSIFGWLAQMIASLITVVVCLSAKIEVLLRVCFCPLGIACIADPEQGREGMRYLKKLLASAFYCMAIVLALYAANMANIGSIISTSSVSGSATDILGDIISWVETVTLVQLAAPLAAIGAISVAKSTINEAFGA